MIDINKSSPQKSPFILEAEKHSNKIKNSIELYLESGSANLPGVSNLYYAPIGFLNAAEGMYRSYSIRDYEGIYESGIRITQAFFSYVHAVIQATWNILYVGKFLHFILNPAVNSWLAVGSVFSRNVAAFGFAICALEGVQEIAGLIRSRNFLNENNPSQIEDSIEIENNFYLEKLSQMRKDYFTLSTEELSEIDLQVQNKTEKTLREKLIKTQLEKKKNALIRRVRPWLANQLEAALPELLKNLASTHQTKREKAKEKAALLFKNIATQSHKHLLVHSTGLLSTSFTITGLILGCFVLPLGVALAFLFIGMILSCVRYCLYHGFMDSEGWDFSAAKCIPDFIKDIYAELFPGPVQSTSEIFYPIQFSYALPKMASRKASFKLDYTFKPSQ
jgi:hypothetical protein